MTGGRHTVIIQAGAGERAAIRDSDYLADGARIVATACDAYHADIVLKVRKPEPQELALLRKSTLLVGLLSPHETS